MGIVLVSAACDGSDATPPSSARSAEAAALGQAEATLSGATPAAQGQARAVGQSTAAATTAPRQSAAPSGSGSAASPGPGGRAAAATPHPETPDPCGLVTAAEAEVAIGARPMPGRIRRSRDSAEVRCTYDYLGAQTRSVIVSVWKGGEARAVYDLRRSAYSEGATIEDVRGLGDRAFVVKGDDGWINVLKGDVYLSIQVVNQVPAAEQSLNGQELRNRTMAVARAAAGRL